MAKRTEALCNGRIIGIESIYTVINGKQINKPNEVERLRQISRRNELFCTCGCGANVTLVAGDRNLREQHFRIRDVSLEENCHLVTEGETSVDSKIVLKCWLDDKLMVDDVETRVPIYDIDDTKRRYEFSLVSRSKKIAINYCYLRTNLSDEKLSILEKNSKDIKVIHIVDESNKDTKLQYPEWMKKVQDRQGYCLFLDIDDRDYSKAKLEVGFYAENYEGHWEEVSFAKGFLNSFEISNEGMVFLGDESLDSLLATAKKDFDEKQEQKRERRRLQEKAEAERQERIKAQAEEAKRQREATIEQQRIERERIQKEVDDCDERIKNRVKAQEEEAKEKRRIREQMREIIDLPNTLAIDEYGRHWLRCKKCNRISFEDDFATSGYLEHVNWGICKMCNKSSRYSRY